MQSIGHTTLREASGLGLLVARLLTGLLQGVALYLLIRASMDRSGIAATPVMFYPTWLIALLVPPALIVSFGRSSGTRLALWMAMLVGVVVILGWHDAWRASATGIAGSVGDVGLRPFARMMLTFPSLDATFITTVFVFSAYCLTLAVATTKSWFAPYDAYFENTWKVTLQVCLASLFVCAVFLVLWLGAGLFVLLDLRFLDDLLHRRWFNLPVGALAFAAALHITDVRPDIIRGSRTLVLSLLSWLLLILVVIVAGFLAALPFTGLEMLWATRSATWILLGIVAIKILFINAVFKGGPGSAPSSEQSPRILRICMRIACLMLLPLVTLAAYALTLRIAQYGLTPHRVLICAVTAVAYCYAIGYLRAAIGRTDALAQIGPVNVFTAWVTLALLVAIGTSVADPARIAVASQVKRLLTGKVTPEQFDFDFLRYKSSRYGLLALAQLQQEQSAPNAATIRSLSTRPIGQPRSALDTPPRPLTLVSHTPGKSVPASFLAQDWTQTPQHWALPACLNSGRVKCDAYLIDLAGNQKRNVVLFVSTGSVGFVFDQASDDSDWALAGKFSIAPDCDAARDALTKGTFQLLAPKLRDIQVNGKRIAMEATPIPAERCGSR